ncbi:hypothetical protein RY27_22210, partial [Litorilinea aerophila]
MAKSATQQARGEISFGRLMGTSIAARLLVDTHSQIFNPFLSLFAAGLGTDVVTMGQLVSLRNLMGLCAPFLGVLADRQGYRRVLRLSLLLGAAGSFLIAGSYHLSMAVVGMVLSGLGIAGFIPTLQAYLSARLPYARRARGMGMLEYSWALTGIVSLSLIGWLIQEWGWRAPFWLLGVGMLAMWTVFTTLPETTGSHGHGGGRGAAVPARGRDRATDTCLFRPGRKCPIRLCRHPGHCPDLLRRAAGDDHPRHLVEPGIWPGAGTAGN